MIQAYSIEEMDFTGCDRQSDGFIVDSAVCRLMEWWHLNVLEPFGWAQRRDEG